MIKNTIIVPRGIRYVSDWEKLENGYSLSNYCFPHILDKQITGCGFTEYCITNNMNIVLCSPRRVLLENKMDQHSKEPNVFYYKNDIELQAYSYDRDLFSKAKAILDPPEQEPADLKLQRFENLNREVESRIHNFMNIGCKILVTYDSFRHVKEVLKRNNVLDNFYVVVDEFQSIFTDSKFKPDSEIELLDHLSDIQKLCFVSATPMIDKYLEMLDEFKDLPYYELDWASDDPGRVVRPEITPRQCKSVIYEANNVVKSYLDGNFKSITYRDCTGKLIEVVSREAVIYVNSVKNICEIIKKNGLTPENTNVLCANTIENCKKIRKAFKDGCGRSDGSIGVVPKRGEPHKMFTLCTRTVYLGADFYSTNARSFIVSDANIETLAVDVSLDLPQILGRQRLIENPWKNRVELYYKPLRKGRQLTKEDFDWIIEKKRKNSLGLLEAYNKLESSELQFLIARKYEISAKVENYRTDFVSVNKHVGSTLVPVFNNLVMVAEMRTYEIQQIDFKDRVSVLGTLESFGNNVIIDAVNAKIEEFNRLTTFPDKMRLVCSTGFDVATQNYFLSQIPIQFGSFFETLGPERINVLKYRRDSLIAEVETLLKSDSELLKQEIINRFSIGLKYSKGTIKQMLGELYLSLGINKVPKATDLLNYFLVKDTDVPRTEDPKKRDKGYLILGIRS